MARPLRIQFPGAVYHVMARGNGGQALFHEDRDYQRMFDGLEKTVARTGWEVLSFVWMPNHIHLFFRTPKPNLSRGMQYLLSGYANWYAKRHQRTGHLFQGRFKGELIEDETYFWNVSRYIHLNPVRGKKPLVTHPRDWQWGSYGGYASRRAQMHWIAYDSVYRAWEGTAGGTGPERGYRRFVEQAIADPPDNPFSAAREGWLLGSEKFVKQIRRLIEKPTLVDEVPAARRLESLEPAEVIAVVAGYFDESIESYRLRRSVAAGRDLAAYLAHCHTTATLRDLAGHFGLGHPDSVSNLIRRTVSQLSKSPGLRKQLHSLEERLLKTENRV